MKLSLASKLASSAVVVALSLATNVHAASIATYDFNTYTTSSDTGAAVGSTSPNLTATNYVPNTAGFKAFAGNTATAGNYMFTTNSGTAYGVQSTDLPATEALAVSNATYYSFTLTPTAGGNFSFASTDALTFQQSTRVLTGGTTPYTTNFFVRTSVDGFAADVGNTVTQTQTGTGSNALGTPTGSISLASLGTLATDQALTVRFYAYDNAGSTNNDIKIDNVIVNGTATAGTGTPEPAALGTLAVAGVGLVRRRRGR